MNKGDTMQKLYITSKAKQRILLEKIMNDELLHEYKFMTKEELLENLYFKYDKRAIYYIMKEYHEKVENAIMYLDHLFYVEEKEYNSKKLNQLVEMKQQLERQNLLIKNPLFSSFLKNHEVVIDEGVIDKFYLKVIEKLKEITTVTVLTPSTCHYCHDVYEYESIESEIDATARKIANLIHLDTDINRIKLVNVSDEYLPYLKRIFSFYHIPIELKEKNRLYGTTVASLFLNKLDKEPISDILDELKEKDPSKENSILLEKIVDIINQYSWYDYDFSDIKDLLIYDLKQTSIPTSKKAKAVSCITLEEVKENDIVFFIGFNTDTVPVSKKDEDFITDAMQEELGFSKSYEWNKLKKQDTIRKIDSILNLTISYKKIGSTKEAYPSSLLSEINVRNVIKEEEDVNHSYSVLQDKLKLSRMLDQYTKYGTISKSLTTLYTNYANLPYKTYEHKFTGLKKEEIHDYFKKKDGFNLSYSHLNTFMKCHFRYYLDQILKLDEYEQSFSALIGSYFHKILECMRKDNFDFDKETEKFFFEHSLSKKESFLLKKLIEELKLAMKIILEQESFSHHDQFLLEEKFEIPYEQDGIKITMKGFIDKIMLQEKDNKEYLSLIDYKTGGYGIDLNGVIHGFNLQLPIYAYLVKRSNRFSNAVISGFYISPILVADELVKDDKTSYDRTKEKMKLIGYSNKDENILEQFDITYRASEVIKSMKTTSKGFGPHTKVLSSEEIDALVNLVEKMVKEAITDILNGEFSIHPKRLNDKDMSCDFCPYQDICFKTYDDYLHLEEQDYKEFLGGEVWEEDGQTNN